MDLCSHRYLITNQMWVLFYPYITKLSISVWWGNVIYFMIKITSELFTIIYFHHAYLQQWFDHKVATYVYSWSYLHTTPTGNLWQLWHWSSHQRCHLTCIKADINVPHKKYPKTVFHNDSVLIGEAPWDVTLQTNGWHKGSWSATQCTWEQIQPFPQSITFIWHTATTAVIRSSIQAVWEPSVSISSVTLLA